MFKKITFILITAILLLYGFSALAMQCRCANTTGGYNDVSCDPCSACPSNLGTNCTEISNTPTNQTGQNGQTTNNTNSYTLQVPIGSVDTVPVGAGSNPFGDYFKMWYGFIIGTVGILATIMIIIGGFQWLSSRGNSGAIKEGQDRIFSAIIGLGIAFLAYTILNLVNPGLTNLDINTSLLKSINYQGNVNNNTRSYGLASDQLPEGAMQQAKNNIDRLADELSTETNQQTQYTDYRHIDGADPEHSFETYKITNTSELEQFLRTKAAEGQAIMGDIGGRVAFVYDNSAYMWNDSGWTVITPDINQLYTLNNNTEILNYFNELNTSLSQQ